MLRGTRSYFTSFSHFSYKVRPIINLHFTDEESKVSGSWAVSGNLEYKSKRSNPETTVNHSFASDAFSGYETWPGQASVAIRIGRSEQESMPIHTTGRRPQRDPQRHGPTLALHLYGLRRKWSSLKLRNEEVPWDLKHGDWSTARTKPHEDCPGYLEAGRGSKVAPETAAAWWRLGGERLWANRKEMGTRNRNQRTRESE